MRIVCTSLAALTLTACEREGAKKGDVLFEGAGRIS